MADWIKEQEKLNQNLLEQEWRAIEEEEVTYAIKKTNNWKSPGKDEIPNFWLKKHTSSQYEHSARNYSNILQKPEEYPSWLTDGVTYLLPKLEETTKPKNYRPITCLSTLYKILTSIIADRTYKHLEENESLSAEQKGSKKGSYGCKVQLLINKMILEHCRKTKKI